MYKLFLVLKVDTTRYFNVWKWPEKPKKWGFSIGLNPISIDYLTRERDMYYMSQIESAFLNSAQFTYNCGIRTVELLGGPESPALLDLVELYWRQYHKIGMLIGSDYIHGVTSNQIRKASGWQFGPVVANPNMGSTDPEMGTYHPIQFFWKDISNLKTEQTVNWKHVPINSTQTPFAPQSAIFAGT